MDVRSCLDVTDRGFAGAGKRATCQEARAEEEVHLCGIVLRPDDCDLRDCPDGETWCIDCDRNGLIDECDVLGGASDCNENNVPDRCEFYGGDCNGNGQYDGCDILSGYSEDENSNGIPDEARPENVQALTDAVREYGVY